MFIGGESVELAALERKTISNPANSQPVDTVPVGTAAEVERAVRAAEDAFPRWWATSAARRGELVHHAARHVLAHIDELSRTLTDEQGKPLRESRLEIHRFVLTLEHYAGSAKNLRGAYVPDLDRDTHGLVVKRPLGVVAAIVPWNFPTTLLANKLAPALVAGNTLVAKPADTTPLTTLRIAELMHEAGLPAGVFNVVTGRGSVIGTALVEHPVVRKIGFTGSTPVGEQIMAQAAKGTKRLTLELGGSDPMIVCDDADVEAAASAASVGRFFNCGQACLAVKRLFVFESVADRMVELLVEKAGRLTIGPGTQEGVFLGPMHSEGQRAEVEEQVADALASGGELLHGGGRPDGDAFDRGWFYEPTLIFEPARDSRVATEEVFGPALPIWRVSDLDEAIERANDSPFGLGSSIWTHDLDAATWAAERIEAGYTWINSPQRIFDELPFGGWGASGYGKEHGMEALDFYMESKAVVVRRSAKRLQNRRAAAAEATAEAG
jgi:succinate-semialdehyde dehydrogenase/glutarate-semialdehyde dehydrogenase